MANEQLSNIGSFVPTTNIWDVQQIQSVNVNSSEFKELLVRLYQNINNIVLALNIKDVGYYTTDEFLNGQLFFPNPSATDNTVNASTYRQVYRTVVNFGSLPNAGSKSVAHNINIDIATPSIYSFTRIYGAASKIDQTAFIPLPYASQTLNLNIQLDVTDTNITVTTDFDYSDYELSYIILEYIKS